MNASADPRLLRADTQGIDLAARALRDGKLVAFPSETVYGLGGDATNDKTVASIYNAKGRPSFNPLIVHVPSIETAEKYVAFDDRAYTLCEHFCPGALTIVLPRKPDSPLSLLVSAGLDSVAVRIPNHPVAQALLTACDIPIAGPSANRSGAVSPTSVEHVLDGWPDPKMEGPEWVVNGGECEVGVESSVIDLTTTKATLLRPGGVSLEDINQVIGPVKIATSNNTSPKSPGMLSRHYSPNAAVFLNATGAKENGVFLGFGPDCIGATCNLSETGNLSEAAANLFAMLRHLDTYQASSISVAPVPMNGLGLAINDRLKRAASP